MATVKTYPSRFESEKDFLEYQSRQKNLCQELETAIKVEIKNQYDIDADSCCKIWQDGEGYWHLICNDAFRITPIGNKSMYEVYMRIRRRSDDVFATWFSFSNQLCLVRMLIGNIYAVRSYPLPYVE